MKAWSCGERRREAIRTSRTAPVSAPRVAGVRRRPPPPPPPRPSPPEPPIARSMTGNAVDSPSYGFSSPVFSLLLASFQFFGSFASPREKERERRECVRELEILSLRGLFPTSPIVYNEAPYRIYLHKNQLSFFLFVALSGSFVGAGKGGGIWWYGDLFIYRVLCKQNTCFLGTNYKVRILVINRWILYYMEVGMKQIALQQHFCLIN